MNKTITTAVLLFAVGAVLVAATPPATSQPYPAAPPSQTAYYQAPVVLSKNDAARLDRVAELLERNNKLLEQLVANTTPGGPAKAARPIVTALTVAKTRCAGCHTPGRAAAKGAGFTLFADNQATVFNALNQFQKTALMRELRDGTMPKGGKKLSTAEIHAFELEFEETPTVE